MKNRFAIDPKRQARKPLRTATELAEEFGVSVTALGGALTANGAPKPRLRNTSSARIHSNTWYDPEEVRRWWAARSTK